MRSVFAGSFFKLGIEVNPTFTHSCDTVKPYGCYDRSYHQKKSLLAEENDIRLLQLYNDDFLEKCANIVDI